MDDLRDDLRKELREAFIAVLIDEAGVNGTVESLLAAGWTKPPVAQEVKPAAQQPPSEPAPAVREQELDSTRDEIADIMLAHVKTKREEYDGETYTTIFGINEAADAILARLGDGWKPIDDTPPKESE